MTERVPPSAFSPTPRTMSETQFVQRFGGVYEHSPWIAQRTYRQGLGPEHDTPEGLAQAMATVLAQASKAQQRALINAHPDLAGRAAVRGELTAESTSEQAGAGLDQCTGEEFDRFQTLNDAYRAKFGFPFIIAVRGLDRTRILAAFEQRLNHSPAQEFEQALVEIDKIARLRLTQLAKR